MYWVRVIFGGTKRTHYRYMRLKKCSLNFMRSHGRLSECFESAGGNAAAATFIVISQDVRGSGFGTVLLSLLELEAERLGFHYIYLWTKTAIGFYEKIGYQQCERVSLKRPCLKKLASNEVESLEALLLKRQSKISQNDKNNKQQRTKETILLPPDDDDNNDDVKDVWLRKRLVEHVGSTHVPFEERLEEMKVAFDDHPKSDELQWCYHLINIPWQAQIGPSCGLAALRMAREYFLTATLSDEDKERHLPSLLGEAQERGFTTDGEVFDANNLRELADEVCGIECHMWSMQELTPSIVYGVLAEGGVFILPYDTSARTRLPACLSGRRAHYGIIVGIAIGLGVVAPADVQNESLRLRPLKDEDRDGAFDGRTECDQTFLLVQHSLSSNLAIAPWPDFIESNQQLVSMNEAKFGNTTLDLRDRIIVCKRLHPGAMSNP